MKKKIYKKMILIRWLMFFSALLVGSPLVIFMNNIEPMVLGVPFFLFWNFIPTVIIFFLMLWHSKLADHYENLSSKEGLQ